MLVNFLNAMILKVLCQVQLNQYTMLGYKVEPMTICLDLASDTTVIIILTARSDISCVASKFLCMFGPTRVSESWCLQ